MRAWYTFATDARSYLIRKFPDIYREGRSMGGRPKQFGELISTNMTIVMQLRQQRAQATTTMIGLLYGITSASAFAFFTGFEVVNVLADPPEQFDLSGAGGVGRIIYAGVYDIPLIEYRLLVIPFNALPSSVMIRPIDGGNEANAYLHFVFMTWLGYPVSTATKALVPNVLPM